MKLRSLGIAAFLFTAPALALGGREASADVIYELSGVTFGPPGGTATGTFTTNDAITALVTYDITTSTVRGFPGFEYTPATAPTVLNGLPNSFVLTGIGGERDLALLFTGGLTATGATLSTTSEETVLIGPTFITRHIESGSVVGVPEPSSLLVGGIAALAGLGLWAWRRRAACRLAG
jgi:hypothetical protein